MRTVPPGRRRLRADQAPVAALAAAILLTGLTACDTGGDPELDHLREQMEQDVDDARASVEGVQREIEGAGLDEETVRRALESLGEQIDRLTTQIDGA